MDFACQRLENGRQARILAVLDCFTRECLLLKAAPSFPAIEVQRELEWLFLVHGKPGRIVSDNGPEFRALKLPDGVEAGFIQPGKPWPRLTGIHATDASKASLTSSETNSFEPKSTPAEQSFKSPSPTSRTTTTTTDPTEASDLRVQKTSEKVSRPTRRREL